MGQAILFLKTCFAIFYKKMGQAILFLKSLAFYKKIDYKYYLSLFI